MRFATRRTIVFYGAILCVSMLVPAFLRADEKSPEGKDAPKKVVFLAGRKSHGYGAHEHRAGCLLLAKGLNENMPGVAAEVIDGWPEDESVLDEADSIVIYCDGAGGHMAGKHLERLAGLMGQGKGLVCLHYAVEVTKGRPGDRFLSWLGGYFELNWSVNPHWTAEFKEFPDHAIARGVEPFSINDEWYYNMRFRPDLKGVTPVLTAVPPDSTRTRQFGGRSGNPYVRSRLGKPEHVAWATEREDGGRGFGFTGGHVHWNWGNDNFRKLVLNAIVWTAHAEVPENGVPVEPLSVDDLMANQDEPVPQNFNKEHIEKLLADWREE